MKASPTSQRVPTERRTIPSVLASIFLGGLFGAAACIGMGIGFMAEIAFIFGVIVGFMCSPALVFALRFGPWASGLVLVAAPTLSAAYITGRQTGSNHGPFVCMAVSVAVYISVSVVRGVIGVMRYPPRRRHECARCGYDRRGLAPGAVCPECGHLAMSAPTPTV